MYFLNLICCGVGLFKLFACLLYVGRYLNCWFVVVDLF